MWMAVARIYSQAAACTQHQTAFRLPVAGLASPASPSAASPLPFPSLPRSSPLSPLHSIHPSGRCGTHLLSSRPPASPRHAHFRKACRTWASARAFRCRAPAMLRTLFTMYLRMRVDWRQMPYMRLLLRDRPPACVAPTRHTTSQPSWSTDRTSPPGPPPNPDRQLLPHQTSSHGLAHAAMPPRNSAHCRTAPELTA